MRQLKGGDFILAQWFEGAGYSPPWQEGMLVGGDWADVEEPGWIRRQMGRNRVRV